MTIAGDMAAYVSSCSSDVSMEKAKTVIKQALEAADGMDFAGRFAKTYEWDNGTEIYLDVIRFLKDMNR
jgi:hypothetical protein